jgi:hypothetical protein
VRSGFPPSPPKGLVIVVRFVFDLTHEIENTLLAASLDILSKSCGDRLLFCTVLSHPASLLN